MRRNQPRTAAALLFLLLLVLGAARIGLFLRTKGFSWTVSFSAIAGLIIAALGLAVPLVRNVFRWGLAPLPAPQPDLPKVRDDLAAALKRQWADEERLHQVNDPRPLPVRWEAPAGSPGQFDDIAAAFRGSPAGRLIVLGGPGAGKSILVIKLARDLLAARQPGTLVPVIMPAIGWDADTSLNAWIASQLGQDHPGLAAIVRTATGETTSLADLVAADGVLPIIDGLDELPDAQRGRAVTQINAAGSDIPLVVTSRPAEYQAAVSAAGRAVSRAEVIELLPLRVAEIKAYLGEATAAGGAGRWDPAFDELDAEPEGPLSRALSAPLMIWLARTVYDSSDSDPAELVDQRCLPGQAAIEQHLLDSLVPALYARRARRPRRSGFRCGPEQAQRWLSRLAAQLREERSAEIAWWRLPRAARFWRPAATAVRALLLWSLFWYLVIWTLSRFGDWQDGSYIRHASLRAMLFGGPLGRLAWPAADQIGRAVYAWLRQQAEASGSGTGPLFPALASSFSSGIFVGIAIAVAMVAAAVGALSLIAEGGVERRSQPASLRVRPVRTTRAILTSFVCAGLLACLLMAVLLLALPPQEQALTVASFFSQWRTWQLVLLFSLIGLTTVPRSFRAPLDVSQSLGPAATLRRDRQADITVAVVSRASFAVLLWLWSGPVLALAYGAFAAAVILIRLVLGSNDMAASERYASALPCLALSRRLPWRVMAFLADARARGVLRQVGAVYQFRHPRLQECLAGRRPRKRKAMDRLRLSHVYHDERFGTRELTIGGRGGQAAAGTNASSFAIWRRLSGYAPQRLLRSGESPAIITRHHPAIVVASVSLVFGALILVGLEHSVANRAVKAMVWSGGALTIINLAYRAFNWYVSYFMVSDQRIIVARGVVRRNVSEVALAKLTDISCRRPAHGRPRDYGELIIKSAGQLEPFIVDYLPYPARIYEQTCDLLFGDPQPEPSPAGDPGPGPLPASPVNDPRSGRQP